MAEGMTNRDCSRVVFDRSGEAVGDVALPPRGVLLKQRNLDHVSPVRQLW